MSKHERRRRERRKERRKLTLLRLREVKARTGRSTSSIYADINEGTFPAPVPIGPKAVAWVSTEVDDWVKARIAERDEGTAVRATPLAARRPSRWRQREREAATE